MNLFQAMIAFEDGELEEGGVIELFQALVDNGMAFRLQGSYGRTAAAMLEAGLISEPIDAEADDREAQLRNVELATLAYAG